MKDKKKEDYAFDRSKFDNDTLSETDRRKNMLDAAEIIKALLYKTDTAISSSAYFLEK